MASMHGTGHAAEWERGGWLSVEQPRLGTIGMVVLLSAANAICPFAIDMYTPAVPSMPAYFATSQGMVNLTLLGFYLFFSVGMLVFGPICDRTGRKPILVGGMGVFTAGSILCALSGSIEALIVSRVVQALGAGAVCAVSTAIIKDCFVPERRTQLLAVLQVLMVLGPVLAPLVGGFLLRFFSWHANFAALAIVGAVCTVMTLLFSESLPEDGRVSGKLSVSFRRMGKVAGNPSFMSLLVFMSLFSVPYMAYVAVASYVYVNDFHTTEQVYSYFFAATAAVSACGPFVYWFAGRHMSDRTFTHVVMVAGLAMAAVLLLRAESSIWVFFACFAVFVMLEAALRPYITNALLSLQDRDAGSASSLINFISNILGVLGMGLITLFAADYVQGLGVIMVASMGAAALLWAWICHSDRLDIPTLGK